jgi:hypothetical protein
MYLAVPGSDTTQQIIVSNNGIYNANKPFWIEMGSNFDLVDGLQPNNLFAGVFLYKRDIRKFCKKNSSNNIGLFAGVYESKAISSKLPVDSNFAAYYDKTPFHPKQHDSLPIFRDSGTLTLTRVVKNISLFFSPQVRLTNQSANADGIHMFASFWLELQWQRVREEYDYSWLKRVDTIWRPEKEITANLYKKQPLETDFRTHYWGVGLPVYFKEGDVNVFFNPVLGYSNQPYSTMPVGKRKWSFFYIFQFRLNEEKYGFAFTGEVRGLIRKNISPIVSLALTKKFDLSKLIEYK